MRASRAERPAPRQPERGRRQSTARRARRCGRCARFRAPRADSRRRSASATPSCPVATSQRHSTTIVSRSQATSASFIASVESLSDHDQPEEELRRGRVRRAIAAARHARRLSVCVCAIAGSAGSTRVRVVAEQLHASVPQVAHHVAVGADRRDRHRHAQRDARRANAASSSRRGARGSPHTLASMRAYAIVAIAAAVKKMPEPSGALVTTSSTIAAR